MMMNILCTGIILLASTAFASMRSKQPPTSYPDLYTPAIHECGVQNLTIEAKLELNQQNFPNVRIPIILNLPNTYHIYNFDMYYTTETERHRNEIVDRFPDFEVGKNCLAVDEQNGFRQECRCKLRNFL